MGPGLEAHGARLEHFGLVCRVRGGAGGDGGFAVGGTDHFALGEGFVVDELVVVQVTNEVVAALEAVPEMLAFGDVGVRDGGGRAGHLWGW